MKTKLTLLLLAISFLSCKKEKKTNTEVSIQGKWTAKDTHFEYFNAAGAKVYSFDDKGLYGVTFEFGATTVSYGADQQKTNYAITMNGSKKILTMEDAPPSVWIKSLDQSTMVWVVEFDANGANRAVYHDGIYTQYAKSTELTTLNRM
jgi:hypothetical protein